MGWYVVLFFILLVLWLFQHSTFPYKRMISFLAVLFVFGMIGLRDISVGADTQVYSQLYYWNYGWSDKEYGYRWLTTTLNLCGVDFHWFLVIVSCFCAFCYNKLVSSYSLDFVFSTLLFVTIGNFTMFMTGLRQTIAISFIVLAIIEMQKRKWYLFFPMVYIASTFHFSAIMFLPVYSLNYVNLNTKKTMTIAVFIWIALVLFEGPIFTLASRFFPAEYADDIIANAGKYNANILVVLIDVAIFVFCWLLIGGNQNVEDQATWRNFLLLQALVVAFELGAQTSMQIGRIAYYFDIAKIVLIPMAISQIDAKKRLPYKLLILTSAILKFAISVPGGYSKIDNYMFFINLGENLQ